MADHIRQSTAVAIHVRFFDDPNHNQGNNVSGDYYQRAIAKMEQCVPDAYYFLFSDHPPVARTRTPLPDYRVTLVNHNPGDAMAYADLWLMSQCQHHIITNSSYYWWGAWLSAVIRRQENQCILAANNFINRDGLSAQWRTF